MSLEKELVEAFDYRENYTQKVKEAADYLRKQISGTPCFGVVLGSGLGDIAHEIKDSKKIEYQDIPNFPTPTTPGHNGNLFIGELEELKDVPILVLQGRKHYYETANSLFNTGMLKAVFPIHVLASLGTQNLLVTNASGGLNTNYKVGDIMVISSHMSQFMINPLLGDPYDFQTIQGTPTPRFLPMNQEYDLELRDLFLQATSQHNGSVHEGVYIGVTGPTYETQAESLAFRELGADAVGMSIIPEVIVARHRGMRCLGLSCITNTIEEDGTNATSHEEVERILDSPQTKKRFSSTIRSFFTLYASKHKNP